MTRVEDPGFAITTRDGGIPVTDPLALRREDLALLVAGYRRENRSWREWIWVVIGIGGLAAGALLITLGEHFGWPETLGPLFFFSGWAVMLTAFAVTRRRSKRLRERYRFECPACHALLFDGIRDGAELARVEVVIATGNCTHCGAGILGS